MASKGLRIHVTPDANPDAIYRTIGFLASNGNERFQTKKEIIASMAKVGLATNAWAISHAVNVGLACEGLSGFTLTEAGIRLAKSADPVRSEFLHFMMYSSWSETNPSAMQPSWAYRTLCNRYWREETVTLSSPYKNRTVAEVAGEAAEYFSQFGTFEAVSFSTKSLQGAHKWLEPLDPPVLEGNLFRRRDFCSPQLLYLAIGFALRDDEVVEDVDILLTPDKREQICQVCLLAPDAFDRTLDWALSSLSALMAPGTSAGYYGRFLRLNKRPELLDVLA